ncbi:MAG: hypothetical protein HY280_02800 [Nitrospinae bacterium]|nr:hypothetical protein [Nitrospinota bacterium]
MVFSMRGDKVRPISARDMSRKERGVYEKAKEDSDIKKRGFGA